MKHIVVLGHAQCGGIRAFAEEGEPLSPGDFIGRWMALIAPAAKAVGPRGDRPMADYLDQLEHTSVLKTLDNLMTFPCVNILVGRGKLQLHAAYFGVAAGTLSVLDRESGEFVRVAADEHAEIFNAPRF